MPPRYHLLFVCMGNICRSPAAEGVMRAVLEEAGLGDQVGVDSAGTIGYHSGDPADHRMRAAAQRRGIPLTSRARQVRAADLAAFDLVLTMDEDNRRDVLRLARTEAEKARVRAFCDFCQEVEAREVPDPYYGGAAGFERVLDLLEDGCRGLLAHVQSELKR